MRRALIVVVLVLILVGGITPVALASDHLFNAANAPGALHRGFANPVAQNPSGTSGAMARPATVPGEGDPKSGLHTVTPSVDLSLVFTRSGGHGNPQ